MVLSLLLTSLFGTIFCRYFLRALQGTLFPSPVLKAKHLDKLIPEEKREAIKKWKDERIVSCRMELQVTSGSTGSATGTVLKEESIASVVPLSRIPFHACSRDELVEEEPGNRSNLNSEKTAFLNSKRTDSDVWCAKVFARTNEECSSAISPECKAGLNSLLCAQNGLMLFTKLECEPLKIQE